MIAAMRALTLLLLLAAAAPAAAQVPAPLEPGYADRAEWAAAQEAARRREVALENQLNAQDAARRADEGVRALQGQADRAQLSFVSPPGPPAAPRASDMATIPDARLAASNARVRAAASNRR